MAGINKVILVGHLGRDPEIRTLESGVKVGTFTLATTESYRKDGAKVEQTEWHNIVVWRGLAEVVEKYVKKGYLVYIEGKLRTRSYEKDGVKKYMTEVVADELRMLSSKRDTTEGQEVNERPATAENEQPVDDLPF